MWASGPSGDWLQTSVMYMTLRWQLWCVGWRPRFDEVVRVKAKSKVDHWSNADWLPVLRQYQLQGLVACWMVGSPMVGYQLTGGDCLIVCFATSVSLLYPAGTVYTSALLRRPRESGLPSCPLPERSVNWMHCARRSLLFVLHFLVLTSALYSQYFKDRCCILVISIRNRY